MVSPEYVFYLIGGIVIGYIVGDAHSRRMIADEFRNISARIKTQDK
jgi:hypothetical protein